MVQADLPLPMFNRVRTPFILFLIIWQVALKRQQAAEDAIALGIRVMATGESYNYLPAGPILGLPLAMQAQEHSNAERRIRGNLDIGHIHLIFSITL